MNGDFALFYLQFFGSSPDSQDLSLFMRPKHTEGCECNPQCEFVTSEEASICSVSFVLHVCTWACRMLELEKKSNGHGARYLPPGGPARSQISPAVKQGSKKGPAMAIVLCANNITSSVHSPLSSRPLRRHHRPFRVTHETYCPDPTTVAGNEYMRQIRNPYVSARRPTHIRVTVFSGCDTR